MISNTIFTVRLHVIQCTVLLSQFCLSVRLSDACIVKKLNNRLLISQHYTKQSVVFPLQRGLLEIVSLHPKYSPKLAHPFKKRRLRQFSGYNVSTIRDIEKSSIMMNRKSITSFPTGYRYIHLYSPES